jgi:hypothetical protein
MATGPEHYREAERLLERAETWENADTGWKAHLSSEERIARRTADIGTATAHALLAQAAATALSDTHPNGEGMPERDFKEWKKAAGTPKS